MLSNLNKYKIILASKSPRRHELFANLRLPFHTVTIGGIDESYPAEMSPFKVPEYLAKKKSRIYLDSFHGNELIITADTLVIANGKIMGKPKDEKDAKKMLGELSGITHEVITGVSISTHEKQITFSDITEVKFCKLTEDEIEYYVCNFRPMDKAGSYGIQEWIGCIGVEWIRGSYYNVMGLPVHRLYESLKNF